MSGILGLADVSVEELLSEAQKRREQASLLPAGAERLSALNDAAQLQMRAETRRLAEAFELRPPV